MKLAKRRVFLLSVPCLPLILLCTPSSYLSPFTVTPLIFGVALSVLMNFPDAVPSLQKRPLYLQDIVVEDESVVASSGHELWERKRAYYHACRVMVNISTAMLIAGFCEYGYTLWSQDDPTSYMEVCGIVGGVLALLNRAQSVASRVLLKLCRLAQDWDERRRRLAEITLGAVSDLPRHQTHYESNPYFLGVV